jgi:hypothetical protein
MRQNPTAQLTPGLGSVSAFRADSAPDVLEGFEATHSHGIPKDSMIRRTRRSRIASVSCGREATGCERHLQSTPWAISGKPRRSTARGCRDSIER